MYASVRVCSFSSRRRPANTASLQRHWTVNAVLADTQAQGTLIG